jgi:uracil-DNA glycosylase
MIIGQAPGTRVHESGIPWNDPSGVRLRDWLGVDADTFYDPARFAIVPMGFCYPGKGKSGDLPPLPICAATWRRKLLAALPNIKLTLVIGRYALQWHLGDSDQNVTRIVRAWESFGGSVMPLPHPSPRNNIWLKKNAWFEAELLPVLKLRVDKVLD